MRKIKKIIAAILVLAVCLSVMAAPVSAAEINSYPYIYTDSPVLTEIQVGGSVIYQFVPAYTGIYRFYSEGEKDSFVVLRDSSFNEMVSNDDISEENFNFSVEDKLYVGETYYLECSLSARKDSGSYSVTVTKTSGTEYIQILGDEQIEGTIGGSVTLEAEIYPDDGFEGYSWYSNNTGVADVDQNGVVTFISNGYAEIVVVTDETNMTDSVMVYVGDYASIDSGLSVSNTISSDKPSQRYKFTPKESGRYPVSFYSTNGEEININIVNNSTDECIYSNTSSDLTENVYFEAGYSYIIDIYNYDIQSEVEFVLGVSTLISLNGISIVDYNGNEISDLSEYIGKGYGLTVKYDPEDISEDISWKSSDDNIVTVDEYGNVTLVSVGDAVITATAKSGVSDTVNVTVKDYTNAYLYNSYNEYLYSKGERYIYKFVPEEDGYYNITASNHSGYFMSIRLLENEYGDTLYGDFERTYYFTAGSEHLIQIQASGEDFQPANFSFFIDKVPTATEIHLYRSDNEYEEISYVSGYEGYSEYLTYKFSPEDSYSEELKWASSDESIAYVENDKLYYVGAGIATITASVESGASTTLTVEVYAAQELTTNVTATVSPTEPYQTIVYKFTPDWTNYYGFKIAGGDNIVNCNIKEVGKDNYLCDSSGGNYTVQAYLQSGKTYYIYLRCPNREYSDYTVTPIQLKRASAVYINGDETISGYAGSYTSLYYNFGEGDFIRESVTWSSSDEKVATVNVYGTVTFVGVGTAVITVTSENNLTDTVTVNVSEMPNVNVGEETTVTIDTENEMKSYKFTVEEAGKYAVYVNSEMYTCTNLGIFGGSIDFSNAGYNYRIEFTAEAGTEYFIETYIADGDMPTGSYTFQIVKLSAPKEMYFAWGDTVLSGVYKVYANSEGWLNIVFGPEGSYSENYTVTGDNDEVAEISENGYARYKTAGTVNITATSESGLTATLTVIVEDIPNIELGNTYTVEYTRPNEYRYYKFTPDETGYYKFNVYSVFEGYTNICDSNYNYIGGLWCGNAENNYGMYQLNAGETYNIDMYLYNNSIGVNTLLVTRVKGAEAIRFTSDSPSNVYVGDAYWYNVEALMLDETGGYVPTDEDVFIGNVDYTVSDKTVAEIYEGNYVRFIKEGTVTITASAECGASAEITVTVSDGQAISLGETVNGYLENWDSEVRYKFTPEKDGVYGAFFNANLTNGKIAVYDEEYGGYRSLVSDGGGSFVLQYKMTAGETYYVIAYSGYGNFSITVNEITTPATSVYFDIQQPNYCVVGDRYTYDYNIRFLPEGSIREDYTLSVSDDTVAKVDGTEIEYIGEGTITVTVTSENGLTDSFEVTVKKPIELEIGKTESVTTEHAHEEIRFLFTVEEEGWYGIYMNSDRLMSYSIGYIENGNKYFYEDSSFEKPYVYENYLYPETTYYVEVYDYYCYEISTTDITVRKLVAATGFSIEEDVVTGYGGDRIKLNASFTPAYSKSEEIAWSTTDESVATAYDGVITIHGKGTATITAITASGFTDSVEVTALGYKAIEVNSSFSVELTNEGLKYYEFTPDETAVYRLYSSDGIGASYAYLYDKDFNEIASAPTRDGGFALIRSFEKGATYYFGLGSYNSSQYNEVTFEKLDAKKLELGEEAQLSLEEGKSLVFAFTPNESKTYKLYSMGSSDTYATLYDSDFNIITSNDDDDRVNFGITYNLTANSTYYLEVMGYSYQAIECTVKVKEIVAVEEVKITQLPNKTEYYAGCSAQALNLYGLQAEIVFADGTSEIWEYGEGDTVGEYTVYCETNYSEVIGDIESVYVMCGDKSAEFPITIIENPVESIEVIHNGVVLYENYSGWYSYEWEYYMYYVDYRDILIKINYTDGSFAIANSYSVIDGYSLRYDESQQNGLSWTLGSNNFVTVYYCNRSVDVNITIVEPDVKSVKVLSSPDYVYQWGDMNYGNVNEDGVYNLYDYTLVGLSLELTYNDGTTEVLNVTEDNEYEIRDLIDYELLPVTDGGTYTAPISYMGCAVEMSITVNKPDAVSIEVIKDPDVTVSAYGTCYNFNGMQLKITDSNGGTETVTVKDNCKFYGYIDYYVIELEDSDIFIYYYYDAEGNESLNIVYGDASCIYDGMTQLREEAVTDFEVTKFSFDPSEIEISATFADGSTEDYKGIDIVDYADDYGFSGYVKSAYGLVNVSAGTHENIYGEVINYYVNFGDMETEIDGTVTIESIEINTLPEKLAYIVGEELDVNGLTVKVNYSDGSSNVYESGYTVSYDRETLGTQDITIAFAGYSAIFEITVSEMIYGDANGDGEVDTDDLVALQKVLLGVESENINCDANGDGDVNILDFIRMKKHFSDENTPLGPDNTTSVTTEVAAVAENKNTVA